MSDNSRRRVLETTGLAIPVRRLLLPRCSKQAEPFFFALDKVQVKYEMLRAHFCEGGTVTDAARVTWVLESRVLLGGRRVRPSRDDRAARRSVVARKGPIKLTGDVQAFLYGLGACSAAEAARQWPTGWACACTRGPSQRARQR